MLDCMRQSFPMVLGQLPRRIKLNKKAKISEQKKFLAKETGISGLGASIRTIYADKQTISRLYEIANHFQIRILRSLNQSLADEEISFILSAENTVAFCDYCKYLGLAFSIDDENRKPYEVPNLTQLYEKFELVSWIVVNSREDVVPKERRCMPALKSPLETVWGIAVHCGARSEYEQYVQENANNDTIITDCVNGYLQYTGFTEIEVKPSKEALDFMLRSAVPNRDKTHVSELDQISIQDMLRRMSC